MRPSTIEQVIQLIASTFRIEITYYAHSNVAITAAATSVAAAENWTQKLFEEHVIASLPPVEKGDRFIEVERTLTSLYCLLLQQLNADDAYHAFTAAQIDRPGKLTRETFQALYHTVNRIVGSRTEKTEKSDILIRLIVYSDLGKSGRFKDVAMALVKRDSIKIDLSTSLDPDEFIYKLLQKLSDAQLSEILPSFSSLSTVAKQILKGFYPVMRACLGHLYFLERGSRTLEIIANALHKIPEEKRREAIDLVFLAQQYDGFGAQGQCNIAGSLTCNENFYRGFHALTYETLLILERELSTQRVVQFHAEYNAATLEKIGAQVAFDYYTRKRAQWLGFIDASFEESLTPQLQFLTRIGSTLRGFTPEFGTLLLEEFECLSTTHKQLLIMQFSFDHNGVESWTDTHYVTTPIHNASRELFDAGNERQAIAKALKASICFAMLLDYLKNASCATKYVTTNRTRVISFREFAFLVTKHPELSDPEKFNPAEFFINQKNCIERIPKRVHEPAFLQPPKTPAEAIQSRRNPCYGFCIVIDARTSPNPAELSSFDTEVLEVLKTIQKKIVDVVVAPQRFLEPYIKQRFFHGAVAGMRPVLDQEAFVSLYLADDKPVSESALQSMSEKLKVYLRDMRPTLTPVGFEIMPTDGTVVMRLKCQTATNDPKPLFTLSETLDPAGHFPKWDASNVLRNTTIAVAICVIDLTPLSTTQLSSIHAMLDEASRCFVDKFSTLHVNGFWQISLFDKRTLSPFHIKVHSHITEHAIVYTPLPPVMTFSNLYP